MFRNPYEIEVLVRHQLAELTAERHATRPLDPAPAEAQLSRRLGRTLIRLGERLAGPEAVHALPSRAGSLDHARSMH